MPIICATDFSPSSVAASQVAATLARRLGQPLMLFHSVQIPYVTGNESSAAVAQLTVIAQETGAALLEDAATALRSEGLTVSTELSAGGPAAEIIRLAEANQAEAVVLGTHGRAGMARFFLGSVAERVSRESPVPVIVVHAEAGGRSGPVATYKSLGLAVVLDGSATDGGVLAWASWLARRTSCEVMLVRLVSPEIEAARFGVDEIWDGIHASGALIEAVSHSITRALTPFPNLADAPRRFVLGTDQIASQVAKELTALEPSFVVLGVSSRKPRPSGHAVQPASLLRALTVPVVCVHERDADVPKSIPTIRSVLVAVDLTQPAPADVLQAYGLLRNGGGRVELCYVREQGWDTLGNGSPRIPLTADERAVCERDLRAMIPPEAAALGIDTNVSVLEGSNAAQAIRQAAARLGTDVIAVATRDRSGLDRALQGSVTDTLIHGTKSPTLVVHTS